MAATEPLPSAASSVQALVAAALLLPGLAGPGEVKAQVVPAASAQVHRFEEAPRALADALPSPTPLRAETLSSRFTLRDPRGDEWGLTLAQDTWSGATPVTTAPRSLRGNRPVLGAGPSGEGVVVVGASPIVQGTAWVDAQDRPVARDAATGRWESDPLVHTLATASPETRQQFDLRWVRPVPGGAWSVTAGRSEERDFRSTHVGAQRRWILPEESGTVSLGLSRTWNRVSAELDHDAAPYITRWHREDRLAERAGRTVWQGRHGAWAASLGGVGVLSRRVLMEAQVSHTQQRGDLGDPYRLTSVIFAPLQGTDTAQAGLPRPGAVQALLEQRPDTRRQWNVQGKLVMHWAVLDAAVHLGAGRYRDDWGVRARRTELEWLQPWGEHALLSWRWRHYRQGAASFYAPLLVTRQPHREVSVDPEGQVTVRRFDPALLPAHYVSDARLAAFSTQTLGLGATWTLARGVSLDMAVERTRQAWRDDGRRDASALRYLTWHLALSIEAQHAPKPSVDGPSARESGQRAMPLSHDPLATHDHGHDHPGGSAAPWWAAPAGVAVAHPGGAAGRWMIGWRREMRRHGAGLQNGDGTRLDAEGARRACLAVDCVMEPAGMHMAMHMLEVGVALTDRLALMVMPHFHTMDMEHALLPQPGPLDPSVHAGVHSSGGWGDTLVQLVQADRRGRWTAAVGVSLPTGRIDRRYRRNHQREPGLLDLGMQTGSGTWDVSLAWAGGGALSPGWWVGAQASAKARVGRNASGYALGDQARADLWLGRALGSTASMTARLTREWESAVRGRRMPVEVPRSAADVASNHGGRHDEAALGFGLDLAPLGLPGQRVELEGAWTLRHAVRGVQLPRQSGWNLRWTQHF